LSFAVIITVASDAKTKKSKLTSETQFAIIKSQLFEILEVIRRKQGRVRFVFGEHGHAAREEKILQFGTSSQHLVHVDWRARERSLAQIIKFQTGQLWA